MEPKLTRHLESWGRYPKAEHASVTHQWRADPLPPEVRTPNPTMLPFGLGRSYGDSCLNDRGTLVRTTGLNRLIAFDRASGVLQCEAGVTLAEILQFAVPQGWFLAVTPGTKFVTVGGAIANDVHGKNHHDAGTFGRFVRRLELVRSDGARFICSPTEKPEWFAATVGGLGLTGLITWAEIQLRAIHNPFMQAESIRFGSLDEFYAINRESQRDFTHTVAWIDCLARGKSLGKGLYNRGFHAGPQFNDLPKLPKSRKAAVPINLPGFAINPLTVKAFNFAYYRKQLAQVVSGLTAYDAFFYPLDAISNWNRVYGKSGFFQYQLVVPEEGDSIRSVLTEISNAREGSPLVVLKTFGSLKSPGMMSFPRPGVTLALDFANHGARSLALFERLDAIAREHGGAVYPAKDARMSAESFRRFFPQWQQFSRYVDPRFSSSFWRRVTAQG